MLAENRFTKLHWILIAVGIVLAAVVRLTGLGNSALNPGEATLAFQSWQAAHSQATAFSGQPLYLVFTTVIFFLFGSSEFLARIFPTLAGIGVVIAPLLIKDRIKPVTLTILIWLLAFEPALIASSRQADSGVITICMLTWLLVWLIRRQWVLSGIFAALALLSGQSIWFALVVFGMAALVWSWTTRTNVGAVVQSGLPETASDKRKLILSTIIAFVSIGSFFLIIPTGLSAFGSSFVDWLERFIGSSAVPIWMPLAALFIYAPLVLVLGVSGGIRSLSERTGSAIFLFIALTSLTLTILLPERLLLELIFTTIPLTFLAAQEITHYLTSERDDLVPSLGIMLLVLVILAFLGQVFSRLALGNLDDITFMITAGGGIVILIVSAILAVFGWSLTVASQGYKWAMIVVLTFITVVSAWRSSPSHRLDQYEFWDTGSNNPEDRLLVDTIHEVSTWSRGTPTGLNVTVIGREDPVFQWNFRKQNSLKFDSAFTPIDSPEVVITSDANDPNLNQLYRGQDFVQTRTVTWNQFAPIDWLNWFTRRFVPLPADTYRYLWVRADLFPGGSNSFSGLKQP